jgi:hypothetical protein
MAIRPFAPLIMRVAKIKAKIPPELDDTMAMLAQGGNPEALRKLVEGQQQGEGSLQQSESFNPEQMRVGEPVMTYQMAEEAYRMHLSGMGTRDIAEFFTKNGSPVSFQTVARWINDYAEESHIERNMRLRSFAKYGVLAGLWVFSMWAMKHLI